MAYRRTGFHHTDADFTQGRAKALADAEALVRRQYGLSRAVKMATSRADTTIAGGHDE